MTDPDQFGATDSFGMDAPPDTADFNLPDKVGRHRIIKILGEGTFGRVYLGHDEQLRRHVAIKVPHASLISRGEDGKAYLAEAQTVANLDHPAIVPVYDVGSSDKFPCYVVSKYIEGTDLSRWVKKNRLFHHDAAGLVATVANALHYAHTRGFFHRDIKPGNILLDADRNPYVADFGLALEESDIGKGPHFAGTPAYMSPEQARGEGHRVDGRSDIYSLGAVLYELLVGRRPFFADSQSELLEQIKSQDPRPPRQIDDSIPRELERICLRALARRASERYTTARDMAEDLQHFVSRSKTDAPTGPPEAAPLIGSDSTRKRTGDTEVRETDSQALQVVPKGLRSFDEQDADFFLDLLQGPRDRNGLPESIRFWKHRVEESDADKTFPVGLIFGPSGCGKSSLVVAGLLPRLSERVATIYVESTNDDTESRLLHGIRKRFPSLPDNLGLDETIATLRRGHGIPSADKVLIVIDQFEQWLHARNEERNTELAQALRQCDGCRVQCIVMARDDFWMAITRFFHEIEVRLIERHNFAAVDLFQERHARKVLAAFGRAFGELPSGRDALSKLQNEFLRQSVASLAEDGKVISVRLALFAEMMKGRAWVPATLSEVGGTIGIGATFLESTFASQSASPEHRYHRKAACAVLAELLPESGTDIKGEMKSSAELLKASGYADRPNEFRDLINILDTEVRLITPTDPEGMETDDDSVNQSDGGGRYYQLTHDYLVPALRDWLTRKQKETWRGRARLRLEELVSMWSHQPSPPLLPTTQEYCSMVLAVPSVQRSARQRELLRIAGMRHSLRWSMVVVLVGACLFGVAQLQESRRGAFNSRILNVLSCQPDDVLEAIEELRENRRRAIPDLRPHLASPDSNRRTHAALALALFGESVEDPLIDAIVDPETVGVHGAHLVAALRESKDAPALLSQRFAETADAAARARLAIVALHLDDTPLAKQVLRLAEDPTPRTEFIHQYGEWHADIGSIVALVEQSSDPDLISGICQAMSLLDATTLDTETRGRWVSLLERLYDDAPDGGTHGAAMYALRMWGETPKTLASTSESGDRHWFVNKSGMTMVRIQAGTFLRGGGVDGALDEVAIQRERIKIEEASLDRPFFISNCEVSLGVYREYLEESGGQVEDALIDKPKDLPATSVSWIDAAPFCNWLSMRDNRTPTYVAEGTLEVQLAPSLPKRTYTAWQLREGTNGYRLPTADQWEYACRARSSSTYPFGAGEDRERLPHYCWFALNAPKNNAQSIGLKLPNGWGLFDMLGNVAEWCSDTSPSRAAHRIVRGGAANYNDGRFASGYRWGKLPNTQVSYIGIRVVCPAVNASP